MKSSRFLLFCFPFVLGAVLLAVYWAGLSGGFAFDDIGNIVGNRALRVADNTWVAWKAAFSSGVAGPLGRGLSMLSFALNYRFFGEPAFSFKLVNFGIHYANALLVLVLARQVLELAKPTVGTRYAWRVAVCVSTIWALHPLNATPVLFIVQRMTSLSAFFMLAGVSLYLYGRRTPSRLGWGAIVLSLLLCLPAAVSSKETGVLFPLYLLLVEWLLLGSFKTLSPKAMLWGALLASALLFALCWEFWGIVTSGYRLRDFDLPERLMTESRVLWFYVQQLLWPMPRAFGLYHDDIPISRGLLAPQTTLLAIFGWIGVVAVAYRLRNRQPLFAFAVFWFLASHALESTFLPLEITFEHRNYLASIGLLLWLVSVVLPDKAIQQWKVPRQALIMGFGAYCGFVSSLRASQWADDWTRRKVEVFNHPQSARANYEYAIGILEQTYEVGQGSTQAYDLVRLHLQRAVALDRIGKTASIGLVYLDCLAGKPKDARLASDLLARFATTPFNHGDRDLFQSLPTMLIEKKLCMDDESVIALISAGISNPNLDETARAMLYALAMDYAIAVLHSIPLALTYAQAAVTSDPGSLALRINLIQLYVQSGKVDQAKQEYARLLTLPMPLRDKPSMDYLKSKFEATEHHAPTR
ncbi:MAG: tetratricopeptide repeat protein [Candidatus Saccharibacteria bacterium]|nr:tetratricopeptide repeat protein [Rhodoferax sp.]